MRSHGSAVFPVLPQLRAGDGLYDCRRFWFPRWPPIRWPASASKGNQLIFILHGRHDALPPQVTLIPLYKIIQALHIHNTYLALIIPYTAYRTC